MNAYFISSLFAIFFCTVLSVFVFLNNKKERANQVLAAFFISISLWIFGDIFFLSPLIHYLTPAFWFKFAYIGASLTPSLYYHFAVLFTKTQTQKKTLIAHYGLSILYLIANCFTNFFFISINYTENSNYLQFEVTPLYYIFILHVLFSTIAGVIYSIIQLKRSTGNLKEQMKYFLAGTILIVLAALFFALVIATGLNIRLDNLFVAGYAGMLAYSFTKKRLMDISVVIGRTMAFVLTILTFCLGYIVITYLYLYYVSPTISISFTGLICLYLMLTGVTFDRLKTAMITTSQKLFVKGKYNYRQTLLHITSDFQTITSVTDFVKVIQSRFLEDIETSTTHIFLPQEFENRKEISETLIAVSLNTKSELPTFNLLSTNLLKLHSPDQIVIFTKDLDPQISSPLIKQNIYLSIASFNQEGKLICLILGGKKLSEDPFNSDDYDLFSALSAQIPAHLTRIQSTRLAAEMDVAQRIQTDILPKNPSLPNLELSCFMAPADEVGGDYYDIYHINDTSWIILGDVAGHGVASGLVMFMVQSIITTLLQSHAHITPGELNYLANFILCQNFERTEESRPMTLVSLSSKDSREFQVNGSHDGILIYRAATKEIESHRVDHFPFGIGFTPDLEKELFINETLQLKTNDILFLYTDGITEAFKNGNPKEEQFGDDRLMNLLKENGHLSPIDIQERLLKELNQFTSKIYVDDVTFVFIKAI